MDEQAKHERQLPWDTDVRVPLPPDAGFTPQEHWAWARIIRGERADMRFFPKDNEAAQFAGEIGENDGAGADTRAASQWPQHRVLSSRFMRTILFCNPWANARARPHVRVAYARFDERLDWENESLPSEVELAVSSFMSDLVVRGMSVRGLLDLQGSRVEGDFHASGLRVDGDLFCREGFSVKGRVMLLAASISGNAEFKGATLEGPMRADRLKVGGTFFCANLNIAEEMRLIAVQVGGNINLAGAKLGGSLNADAISAGGDLLCSEGFTVAGDLRIIGASFGGDVALLGASLGGLLRADGARVQGTFFAREMKRLRSANLLGTHVDQDLQLSRSTIEGQINLTGAVISGEVSLAQNEGGGPKWGEAARLVLRNVTAGAFAGGLDSLRRGKDFVPCDLAGFAYGRIGGLGAGALGSTLASASGSDLRAWLRRCRPSDHFDPAPYRALAKALGDAGRKDRAADVRNALGNYELVAKGTPMMQRCMLALSWLFIGYGERNHRALLWFVALVLIAAAVGYWNELQPAWHSLMEWGKTRAWADWLGFAFGDAVPVVSIDEAHKTFLADRFCGADHKGACERVPDGLTGFYYVVKVFGFVILSYLAAGLSGLAQRKE